jgi:dCMP deaminase
MKQKFYQEVSKLLDQNRIAVFARFIRDLAKLSKCTDKGTAAIITNRDGSQIYSIGINGGPKHGMDCLCTLGGKYTCIHAEANALAKCTSTDMFKTAFCTLSPCVTCASLLVNSGVDYVYYLDAYKDDTGIKILQDAGIRVFHYEE